MSEIDDLLEIIDVVRAPLEERVIRGEQVSESERQQLALMNELTDQMLRVIEPPRRVSTELEALML